MLCGRKMGAALLARRGAVRLGAGPAEILVGTGVFWADGRLIHLLWLTAGRKIASWISRQLLGPGVPAAMALSGKGGGRLASRHPPRYEVNIEAARAGNSGPWSFSTR